MMKHTLALSTLLVAFDAGAGCLVDAPEIGDIGPSSELVCQQLERRFPGSTLAVEGRGIHSPETVTVQASVNSEPVVSFCALRSLGEGVIASSRPTRCSVTNSPV